MSGFVRILANYVRILSGFCLKSKQPLILSNIVSANEGIAYFVKLGLPIILKIYNFFFSPAARPFPKSVLIGKFYDSRPQDAYEFSLAATTETMSLSYSSWKTKFLAVKSPSNNEIWILITSLHNFFPCWLIVKWPQKNFFHYFIMWGSQMTPFLGVYKRTPLNVFLDKEFNKVINS